MLATDAASENKTRRSGFGFMMLRGPAAASDALAFGRKPVNLNLRTKLANIVVAPPMKSGMRSAAFDTEDACVCQKMHGRLEGGK